MKNTFVISCPIDTYSGYGARSRDIVKALINLDKYDVKVMPQRWGNTTWGFIDDHEEWHFLKPHLMGVGEKLTKKPLSSDKKALVFLSNKGNIVSFGKLTGDLFQPLKVLT